MVVWVLFNVDTLEVYGRYNNKLDALYDCRERGACWRVIREETLKRIF